MSQKNTATKNKNSKKILAFFLIFLSIVIFLAVTYKNTAFGKIGIDELLFYLFNSATGANMDNFKGPLIKYSLILIAAFLILILPTIYFPENEKINQKFKKISRYNPLKLTRKHYNIYATILLVLSVGYACISLDAFRYIIAKCTSSNFVEQEYVDPNSVNITFPDQKRNLIHIYLESMENTIMSESNDGASEESITPELESIALDKNNISFSNGTKLGGMQSVYGTTWTVAGMVAQSSGVPLIKFSSESNNSMGNFKDFLPGASSIGEILEDAGYYQELIIGSDASFGGRDKYFKQHGNYEIFDYKTAIEQDKIEPDYKVWWGYEDKKLFEYSKEEILSAAESNKPFNIQILTVDTHFTDGYLDETCSTDFEQQYDNVFACSSKQVASFINWIKQQDFYDNTTILITGDHTGMQTDYYNKVTNDETDYKRTVYNAIINSAKTATNSTNREFTSFDIFPTTLSSMGIEIEGNKLGLGVDLFSNDETLVEKYGLEHVNSELSKRSNFYNRNILIKK